MSEEKEMNKFNGRMVPRITDENYLYTPPPPSAEPEGTVFKGIGENSLIGDIKSSGQRREFSTGAHRDSNTKILKGRWDLIPAVALRRFAVHCARINYNLDELYHQHDLWYWNEATDSLYSWLEGERQFQDRGPGTAYTWDHLANALWMTQQLMHREEDKSIWYPKLDEEHANWMGDQPRWDRISPLFMKRVAIHYQKGGINYGDRNWEKGMPIMVTLDCAFRHLSNWLEHVPEDKEDHLAAVGWNLCSTMHTIAMVQRGLLPETLWEGDGTSDCPFVPKIYLNIKKGTSHIFSEDEDFGHP